MSKLSNFAKRFSDLGHRRVRKNPRIHPRAKSKLLVVRQVTPTDPVESALLSKWWSDYRLQYAAVKNLLCYEAEIKAREQTAALRTDDEGERKQRARLNDNWNLETREQSSSNLKQMLEELESEEAERLDAMQLNEDVLRRREMDKVSLLISLGSSCITRENIDEKIEEIFNSDLIDYNFAVDNKGNVFKGSANIETGQSTESMDDPLSTDKMSSNTSVVV